MSRHYHIVFTILSLLVLSTLAEAGDNSDFPVYGNWPFNIQITGNAEISASSSTTTTTVTKSANSKAAVSDEIEKREQLIEALQRTIKLDLINLQRAKTSLNEVDEKISSIEKLGSDATTTTSDQQNKDCVFA